MNCPRCGAAMRKEGLASLHGDKVTVTFECPACHYRIEQPVSAGKKEFR